MNYTTALFLVCLIFSFDIFLLLVALKRIGKRIKDNDQNISRSRAEILNFRLETKKRDYNARKRDENLLREIHLSAKKENGHYGCIVDSLADNNIKMDKIVKLCMGIENVSRNCANNDVETKAVLNHMAKCHKDLQRIGKLFEETLEKAKKTGRGK
jgi:hypothetical protein